MSPFNLPPKSGYLVSLRRYAELNEIQYKKVHDFSDPDFIQSIQEEELDLLLIRVGAILSGDLISSQSLALGVCILVYCRLVAG